MAQELILRDTSRSYAARGPSAHRVEMDAAALNGRRVPAHVALVRVLLCLGDCLAGTAMACMRCTRLHFSTQTLPASKFIELDRQLSGQQAGLNMLTVEEYLQARTRFDPRARDPQLARRARTSWRSKLAYAHGEALRAEGCDDTDAAAQAEVLADRQMRTLHALHNPDRIVGGRDVIADFGDGQVNSTIGRQWNLARRGDVSRVRQLDAAASCVPASIRGVTRMNGELVREAPAASEELPWHDP